jgi:hypothetical protein
MADVLPGLILRIAIQRLGDAEKRNSVEPDGRRDERIGCWRHPDRRRRLGRAKTQSKGRGAGALRKGSARAMHPDPPAMTGRHLPARWHAAQHPAPPYPAPIGRSRIKPPPTRSTELTEGGGEGGGHRPMLARFDATIGRG